MSDVICHYTTSPVCCHAFLLIILHMQTNLTHWKVSACDLNLGCPQKIAKRGNYGAYLLPDRKKVISVLDAMVRNLACPVTVKIRRLESDEETISLCQEIESIGVSMITVHGRTVTSSKLYTGPVDWKIIKDIKSAVSIPIIANGGVSCFSDALDCLQETGADGVMSSEALLENPKLFDIEGLKTVFRVLAAVLHAPLLLSLQETGHFVRTISRASWPQRGSI